MLLIFKKLNFYIHSPSCFLRVRRLHLGDDCWASRKQIEGAMLARFSPAPYLSLVLRVHDSSKTAKKTPVPPIDSFKRSNKTFTPTPEFLLTIEVGIAGTASRSVKVRSRWQRMFLFVSAKLFQFLETLRLALIMFFSRWPTTDAHAFNAPFFRRILES